MKTSIALFVLLIAGAATFAATVARTVVALKDGTSLSGELIEATPAGVTIRQSPKAEPVMKPWSAIRQVGGGITRESIVAQWRATQADKLCETCKGDGTATCATCGGKSVDPAAEKPCDKCGGTGSTGPCKTPRCTGGKIPCPNPCLKPTDFAGAPDKDGKRWKTFRAKGGSARWSDAHLGQIIAYEGGAPVNKGVCPAAPARA